MNKSVMGRLYTAVVAVVVAVCGTILSPTPAASAAVDVYGTPGVHHVNGRDWMTWCEGYSGDIIRCWTEIRSGGRWVFNNLTYVGGFEKDWAGNPLARTGSFTSSGRSWSAECNTARTGRGGCRAYILSGGRWVFNNQIRFWARPDVSLTWRPPAGSGSATYDTATAAAPSTGSASSKPTTSGKVWTIRLRSNGTSSQKVVDNCAKAPTLWGGMQHVVAHNYCNGWEANTWHAMRRGDRVKVVNTAGKVILDGIVDHDFSAPYGRPAPAGEVYPTNGSRFFWVQVSWPDSVKKDTNHVFVVRT